MMMYNTMEVKSQSSFMKYGHIHVMAGNFRAPSRLRHIYIALTTIIDVYSIARVNRSMWPLCTCGIRLREFTTLYTSLAERYDVSCQWLTDPLISQSGTATSTAPRLQQFVVDWLFIQILCMFVHMAMGA